MGIMSQVYKSEGFQELVTEWMRCLKNNIPPEVFANFIGTMIAAEPKAAVALYLFQSRTLVEILNESGITGEARELLESNEDFYKKVVEYLVPLSGDEEE